MKKTITKEEKDFIEKNGFKTTKRAVGVARRHIKKYGVDTPSNYDVSVKMFGKVYSSTGESVYQALRGLKIIGKIGGMCVVTIKKGDTVKEKILNGSHLWRLFAGSNTMKEIATKQLKTIFPE